MVANVWPICQSILKMLEESATEFVENCWALLR